MDALIEDLTRQIVEHLHLEEEVEATAVDPDAPLFGDGLGLDSIDAVEIVVMLEKHYGIRLTDMETAKAAFRSVRTLAAFVEEQRRKGAVSA